MDGPAWRLTTNPAHIRLPAPNFGQHNTYLLKDLLGLDDAAIAALTRDGVIGAEPASGRHV